jgi:hypothetical protein
MYGDGLHYPVTYCINVTVCAIGVPCHHGNVHPQVEDGGDGVQIWRVAVNILNKQLQTAYLGWSSSLGVWRGANNSSP